MKTRHRIWASILVVAPTLLAVSAGLATDIAIPLETMRVPGLHAAAEIRVDRWGVPHLYAGSEADLFFVQGFNAARDRLFQIDLWRRRGLGQLSEVFGPGFLEQDRAARLFLYRGDMDAEWRIYSARATHASIGAPFLRIDVQGPEPAFWQRGKFHFNLNEHPFAPIVDDAMRAHINVGPIAKNGSEFTPSQSLTRVTDFRQMNGPSVRVVLDVGNWDNSRAVNHPGQSGDPESPLPRPRAALERRDVLPTALLA